MSDTALKLGEAVEYRDGNGRTKLAFVIGTAESVSTEGRSRVDAVEDGKAHLTVISPTGNRYTRHNVPEGEGERTFSRI